MASTAMQKAHSGSGMPALTRFHSNDAVGEFLFLSDRSKGGLPFIVLGIQNGKFVRKK